MLLIRWRWANASDKFQHRERQTKRQGRKKNEKRRATAAAAEEEKRHDNIEGNGAQRAAHMLELLSYRPSDILGKLQ